MYQSSMTVQCSASELRCLLSLGLNLCGSSARGDPAAHELDAMQIAGAHCGGVSRALYKRSMSVQASMHRPYESPKGMTEARSMQSSLQRAPSSVCGVNCGEAQAEQKMVASARRHSRFM